MVNQSVAAGCSKFCFVLCLDMFDPPLIHSSAARIRTPNRITPYKRIKWNTTSPPVPKPTTNNYRNYWNSIPIVAIPGTKLGPPDFAIILISCNSSASPSPFGSRGRARSHVPTEGRRQKAGAAASQAAPSTAPLAPAMAGR